MKNVPAIEFNREGLVGKIQRYSLIPNAVSGEQNLRWCPPGGGIDFEDLRSEVRPSPKLFLLHCLHRVEQESTWSRLTQKAQRQQLGCEWPSWVMAKGWMGNDRRN